MNKTLKYVLFCAFVACMVAYVAVGVHFGDKKRGNLGVNSVEIVIKDSLERNFITQQTIKRALAKDYGQVIGEPLEKVDLKKIETIVRSKSMVLDAQSYYTLDGALHIEVSQRSPVLRFDIGDGLFACDKNGFLFPIPASSVSRATLVSGRIPLHLHPDFYGRPSDEEQALWLDNMLNISSTSKKYRFWNEVVFVVQKNGDIAIKPTDEETTFILGDQSGIAKKFEKIKKYYTTIKPNVERDYSCVNVKYKGQIVCK